MPIGSCGFCLFFSLFSSVVQLSNFYCSIFKFTSYFPVTSIFLLSLVTELLILVIVFFSSKISTWFLLTYSVSLMRLSISFLRLSFFSFVLRVFIVGTKHFRSWLL